MIKHLPKNSPIIFLRCPNWFCKNDIKFIFPEKFHDGLLMHSNSIAQLFSIKKDDKK